MRRYTGRRRILHQGVILPEYSEYEQQNVKFLRNPKKCLLRGSFVRRIQIWHLERRISSGLIVSRALCGNSDEIMTFEGHIRIRHNISRL